MKKFFTLFVAALLNGNVFAQSQWTDYVVNGDFEVMTLHASGRMTGLMTTSIKVLSAWLKTPLNQETM